VVDQLELHLGRRVGAGAAPHGADAVADRGSRVEVRHRVHAEREGDVRAVGGLRADQRPGALEGAQAVLHVLGRARVEERPAGGAARAPVLDHRAARLDAELLVEALRRNGTQLLLGERRDAVPDVLGLALWNPLPEEAGLARSLDGDLLALSLNLEKRSTRLRPEEVHTPR